MIASARAARIGGVALAAAACVNIGAGVVIALGDPGRAADLRTVYDWCRAWLLAGQSLYTAIDASTDYPPNAIVFLSPIGLLPARWLAPLWTAGAVALTPVLPWLTARAAAGRRRPAALALPVLLFLCWAAPRTLLQFSLLSMTLACAAMVLADTRALAAGVALGLALGKPHVAAPIALWLLVTGRVKPLLAAAAVVAAGWLVYDARIAESPRRTLVGYWQALGSQYGGPDGLVGRTSLRGLARLAAGDPATADAIWIALAALLLVLLVVLARRDRSRPLDEGGLAVPAMFCLWSLLATYHNGNNLILMLPAFCFLWFHARPRSAWRWLPIAALQAAMMFDVPARLAGAAAGPGWRRFAIEPFDRVVVLATLGYVSVLWLRPSATPAAARAAQSPR